VASMNFPKNYLSDDGTLKLPVITSYDPIWYLFHSMVSYHQWLWTDCNEYDLIHPDDLDAFEAAYRPFCADGWDCITGMGLDDDFFFGGALQQRKWSFIHNTKVTTRKSYHMPRWNVIYDLEDGSGFYTDSGLKEWCDGKLNSDWFMFSEKGETTEKVMAVNVGVDVTATTKVMAVCLGLMFLVGVYAILSVFLRKNGLKKNVLLVSGGDDYGATIA